MTYNNSNDLSSDDSYENSILDISDENIIDINDLSYDSDDIFYIVTSDDCDVDTLCKIYIHKKNASIEFNRLARQGNCVIYEKIKFRLI